MYAIKDYYTVQVGVLDKNLLIEVYNENIDLAPNTNSFVIKINKRLNHVQSSRKKVDLS
jgi:hypothetical protein